MLVPTICVHGGAWDIPDATAEESRKGCEVAAATGLAVLQQGGSSVDAVEAAIRSLENNPVFDAGTGSALTSAGTVEMDAMIMRGDNLNSGAVANVSNLLHPISAARLVMEKTDHVLLCAKGAEDFALEKGAEPATQEQLVTPHMRKEYENFKQYGSCVSSLFASGGKSEQSNKKSKQSGHDTVGCVCLDASGLLACGTSTGGITAKMPGRVGDSPIISAGGMADNEMGAVSTTGHGESILKVALARRCLSLHQENPNLTLQECGEKALEYMHQRVNGHGGIVSIGADGTVGISFSTKRMCWAWQNVDGLQKSGVDAAPESPSLSRVLEPKEIIIQQSPATAAAAAAAATAATAGDTSCIEGNISLKVEAGDEPYHSPVIAEFVEAAAAAEMDWGFGDYNLSMQVYLRSDASDTHTQSISGARMRMIMIQDAENDGSSLIGMTPASVVDKFSSEGPPILKYESHPLMEALELKYGSFLRALLPDADKQIVDAYSNHEWDGNDWHVKFATDDYVFDLCYQTS